MTARCLRGLRIVFEDFTLIRKEKIDQSLEKISVLKNSNCESVLCIRIRCDIKMMPILMRNPKFHSCRTTLIFIFYF